MQRLGWLAFVVGLLMHTQSAPADDDAGSPDANQSAAADDAEHSARQVDSAKRKLLGEMRTKYFQLEELRKLGQTNEANLVDVELQRLRDQLHRLLPVQRAAVEPVIFATVAHSPRKEKTTEEPTAEASNPHRKLMGKLVTKYTEFRNFKEEGKEAEAEAVMKELKQLRKQFAADGRTGHHQQGARDHRSTGSSHDHGRTDKQSESRARRAPSPEGQAHFAELRKKMHAAHEAGDEQKVAEVRKELHALMAKHWEKQGGSKTSDGRSRTEAILAHFSKLHTRLQSAKASGNEVEIKNVERDFRGAIARVAFHLRTSAGADQRQSSAGKGASARCSKHGSGPQCGHYRGSGQSNEKSKAKSIGQSSVAHRSHNLGCRYCQAQAGQPKIRQAKRCQAKTHHAQHGEHHGRYAQSGRNRGDHGHDGHFRSGHGKSPEFSDRIVDLRKRIQAAQQSDGADSFDHARKVCRAAFAKALAAHQDKSHGSFSGPGNRPFVCRHCQARLEQSDRYRHGQQGRYADHRSRRGYQGRGGDSSAWHDRFTDFARLAHSSHGHRDWYDRGREFQRPHGDRDLGSLHPKLSDARLTARVSNDAKRDRSDDLQQLRQQVRRLSAQLQQVSHRLDRLARE